MARIAVIGGTGYAGRHIVAEAVERGHTVVSVARSIPGERIPGATYVEGTLLDVPSLVAELQGVDVVVVGGARARRHGGPRAPRGRRAPRGAARNRPHRRDRRRRRQPLGSGRPAGRGPALLHRGVQARGVRGDRDPRGPRGDPRVARLLLHPPRGRLRHVEPGRAHRRVPRRRRRRRHGRRRASPSSPVPTSPSRSSTRSRTRSTAASGSPSATDEDRMLRRRGIRGLVLRSAVRRDRVRPDRASRRLRRPR